MRLFATAGVDSMYFHPDLSLTTMRSMYRACGNMGEKLLQMDSDSKADELTLLRKRLQVILEFVKLYRMQDGRPGWRLACVAQWDALLRFCAAHPAVPLPKFPSHFGRMRAEVVSRIRFPVLLCAMKEPSWREDIGFTTDADSDADYQNYVQDTLLLEQMKISMKMTTAK